MKGKVNEVQKCRHSKLTPNNVQVVSEDLGKLRETSLGVDSIQSRTLAFSTVFDLATLQIIHDKAVLGPSECYRAAGVGDVVLPQDVVPVLGLLHSAAVEAFLNGVPDVPELSLVLVELQTVLHVGLDGIMQIPLQSKGRDTSSNLEL